MAPRTCPHPVHARSPAEAFTSRKPFRVVATRSIPFVVNRSAPTGGGPPAGLPVIMSLLPRYWRHKQQQVDQFRKHHTSARSGSNYCFARLNRARLRDTMTTRSFVEDRMSSSTCPCRVSDSPGDAQGRRGRRRDNYDRHPQAPGIHKQRDRKTSQSFDFVPRTQIAAYLSGWG